MGFTELTYASLGAVLLAATTSWAQPFPEQEIHRAGFQPASDEVFDVITEFYAFDASFPLAPRIVDSWEDGPRFEKIVFTTSSGERVPGDLVRPATGDGPFPCALLIHGLGSMRDRWWQDDRRALPETLLEAGIAVFTIDLRYHGERSAENDYQPPMYLTLGDSLFVRSRDMCIQSTIDARRALDYLGTRDDIDADRIGVVGYSMGGMIVIHLGALEPQLRALVACAVPTRKQPIPTDHFNFAPRVRTPSVRLLIGKADWLSSPEDATMLLDAIPTEDRTLTFYEAGHRLPPQFAVDAAEWLVDRLR